MRDHRPQATQDLLKKRSTQEIQERALEISSLNQELKTLLSEEMGKHCRVANYRANILILECGSSSWGARLKFERLNVMAALRRKRLPSLMTIEIKINPRISEEHFIAQNKKKNKKEPSGLSPVAAECLLAIADQASDKLKKKLKSIAAISIKKASL